jgi:hypothetical protein
MTKNRTNSTKNTSAPASPATPAEVLAPEGAQAPSQASTQAETGNSQPTEAVNSSPAGEGEKHQDQGQPSEGANQEETEDSQPAQDQHAQPQAQEQKSYGARVADAIEKVFRHPTQISVTALKDGFRRAGRAWSKESTIVTIEEFDDEQLKALFTEPMLIVQFVGE